MVCLITLLLTTLMGLLTWAAFDCKKEWGAMHALSVENNLST